MDHREELDKSYETDEFKKFVPLPYTRISHYIFPTLIVAILLIFGVASNVIISFVIFLFSIGFLSYAYRIGFWNHGVKKYGADDWVKYVNEMAAGKKK